MEIWREFALVLYGAALNTSKEVRDLTWGDLLVLLGDDDSFVRFAERLATTLRAAGHEVALQEIYEAKPNYEARAAAAKGLADPDPVRNAWATVDWREVYMADTTSGLAMRIVHDGLGSPWQHLRTLAAKHARTDLLLSVPGFRA